MELPFIFAHSWRTSHSTQSIKESSRFSDQWKTGKTAACFLNVAKTTQHLREITMQIRGTSSIQTTTQVNFANKAQTAPQASSTAQLDTADQVDISSEAQMLAGMNDTSEIRSERVAEIRHQIETGQYETPEKLDAVVERLLDEFA